MKNKVIVLVSLIIVGAACFYGGMKYDQRKAAASLASFNGRGNFGNMTDEQRQRMAERSGANGGNFIGPDGAAPSGQRARMGGAGFVLGEILSKDDKSITVKLADGGSKIILFTDSTQITKSSAGSADDLSVGANVTITGSANSDGSVSAQNIQVR